jgi:hypothetical protein
LLAWLPSKVKAIVVSPISWWVGPYARPIRPYLDVGSSNLSSLTGGVVLFGQRGVGMAFVRIEVIVVPSVLVE